MAAYLTANGGSGQVGADDLVHLSLGGEKVGRSESLGEKEVLGDAVDDGHIVFKTEWNLTMLCFRSHYPTNLHEEHIFYVGYNGIPRS